MTYKDRKKINPWPLGLIVGWGLLSLAGYVFGWVDFEAAPKWAVIGAFVLVLIFQFFLSLIGESVIEDGIKAVIVIVLAMFAPNHPISDPLLAALACGGIAAFITNWLGRATERRLYEESELKKRRKRYNWAHLIPKGGVLRLIFSSQNFGDAMRGSSDIA